MLTTFTKDGVTTNTFPTYTTQIFARVFQIVHSQATAHDLGFTHIDSETFRFHVALPDFEFLSQLLQRHSRRSST